MRKSTQMPSFGFIGVFHCPVHKNVNHVSVCVNFYKKLDVNLFEKYLTQNIMLCLYISIAKCTYCFTTYITHTRTNVYYVETA